MSKRLYSSSVPVNVLSEEYKGKILAESNWHYETIKNKDDDKLTLEEKQILVNHLKKLPNYVKELNIMI